MSAVPKVTAEYRDARRRHILDAAARCFVREGFHSTSMQDLFAECALSSGAVYGYFDSKDDLIVAIVEENLREVVDALDAVVARGGTEPIGSALADVLEAVRQAHEERGTAALAVQVWSELLRNPTLAERLSDLLGRVRADFTVLVERRQAAGDLPADVPAATIAALLLSVVPGFIMQLATLGPDAVEGIPQAARTLWS